jgi:hypothetical protein
MITFRWIVAAILISISLYAVIGNACTAIKWWCLKKRATMIPLVGGVAGVIGVLLLPIPWARGLWWALPILDLGCVPLMLAAAIEKIRKLLGGKANPQ